ncbi:SOS response-associated peptidase [Paenibacillus elgii]
MCERFSLTAELPELSERYRIGQVTYAYKPRYNIAPTQQVAVIVRGAESRMLEEHRWGLVPFWGKDAVNADSAAVHEKPAYRKLFGKQRCIIPSNGFYVWKTEGKTRRPIRIVMKDRGVFAIAGLYEVWKDSRGGETRTCTVMTTRSNRLVFDYDERMPVILDERDVETWLDPTMNGEPDRLQSLLRPYAPERMYAYPVSRRVADPLVESEECVEEAAPPKYALLRW